MRFYEFKDVLIENTYNGKVNKLTKEFPDQAEDIAARVAWAAKVFNNRNQAMLWYISLYEVWLKQNIDPNAKARYTTLLGEQQPFDFPAFEKHMNHWLDSVYSERQEIKNIVRQITGNTTVSDLVRNLKAAEDTIKAQNKEHAESQTPIEILPGDKIMLPLGTYDWWHLPYNRHKPESKAMGHCGTCQEEGNHLLSLRNKVPQPVLTFEWNPKTGELVQMKGKENSKPSSKFHPMIVPLLLSRYITSFSRYSFSPSTDFSVFDLSPELLQQVLEAKPKLVTDEITRNPVVIFKAPSFVKADPEVQRVLHEVNPGLAVLLQPNGELTTSHEDWQRAIDIAKDNYQLIIQYAPPSLPGYMDQMFDALIESGGTSNDGEPLDDGTTVYKTAPPAIKNNLELLLRVVEKAPWVIEAIPHYKPNLYRPLAEKILEKNPSRISKMDYRGFADDNLYLQYLVQGIKSLSDYGPIVLRKVDPKFLTYDLCKLAFSGDFTDYQIDEVFARIPQKNMTIEQYHELLDHVESKIQRHLSLTDIYN